MPLFFFTSILYYMRIYFANLMEYPGSHFTRPWRVAFLAVFILAFLIISPAIVLYTTGYRYDFKNGVAKKIGAISIDILPKNSMVYLNDKKIDLRVPIRLKNVEPGKYKIKITADGFYDWEKEVNVENQQTVYIKEIKLIKKSDPEKISDQVGKNIWLSPKNDYLLFTKVTTNTALYLRNLKDDSEKMLIKIDPEKTYSVDWSKNNKFFIVKNNDFSEFYLINTDGSIINITKEKPGVNKTIWDNNSTLLISDKQNIYSFNPDTKQSTVVGKNNFIDWYINNGQIYALVKNQTKNRLEVVKDYFGFPVVFAVIGDKNYYNNEQADLQFVTADQDALVLKKKNQNEMMILTSEKQYNFFGNNFVISPYNNWWLAFTPWELTTYSHGEDPFLLNRSGEKLKKIVILDEYNTIGMLWENKMTVLFPYYFVSHNLINKNIDDIEADSQDRILYFASEGSIWKMNY